MTQVQIIRAIHAAASRNNMAECMRLFRLGSVSEKVYKQVIRESKSNNPREVRNVVNER